MEIADCSYVNKCIEIALTMNMHCLFQSFTSRLSPVLVLLPLHLSYLLATLVLLTGVSAKNRARRVDVTQVEHIATTVDMF